MKINAKVGYLFFAMIFGCISLFQFCKKDPIPMDESCGYPTPIGQILIGKCATSGCHNELSKSACAGLNLATWDEMFKGGRNNSVVIPYNPEQSVLLFSINTFAELGPQLSPTMPINHPALSRDEVVLIRDWIASGAPDRNGLIKYSGDPHRSKIYVSNQGCDLITVFDAKSKMIMRCFDIGITSLTESPHDIQVSPDGDNLYVSFYSNSIMQKYETNNDRLVGSIDLVTPSWHSMCISHDSKYALVSHWDVNGEVAYIDLQNMTLLKRYQGLYCYPHGCAFDPTGNYSYVVCQSGNFIYKTDMTDLQSVNWDLIPLETNGTPAVNGLEKPYVIKFSPDNLKYFVVCQGTNEVRVFKASNDSLIDVIPTTGVPQLIEFSHQTPYGFVTCMIDTANTLTESSVDIINWQNDSYIKTVYPGWQERGLTVDDANRVVYVGNRNVDAGGPAPHHTTSCVGRNGSISLIDMNTLEVLQGWKAEVSVDPYSIAIRPGN
ncbi:hypothetical protein BH09BAC5_BH09BAC5_09840 [soil metagenome]